MFKIDVVTRRRAGWERCAQPVKLFDPPKSICTELLSRPLASGISSSCNVFGFLWSFLRLLSSKARVMNRELDLAGKTSSLPSLGVRCRLSTSFSQDCCGACDIGPSRSLSPSSILHPPFSTTIRNSPPPRPTTSWNLWGRHGPPNLHFRRRNQTQAWDAEALPPWSPVPGGIASNEPVSDPIAPFSFQDS